VYLQTSPREAKGVAQCTAAGDEQQEPPDGLLNRVLKYIPAEIVAGYVVITGLIGSSTPATAFAQLWVTFFVLLFLIFLYTLFVSSVPSKPLAWSQGAISTVASAVVVLVVGDFEYEFINL